MSARKLQQEFDKTNKKIAEGLSVFDDIHEKLLTTEISSQKEKLESDLKKEIKKLQRLRDQLKTWLGDSSIKLDKNLLQENRTKIEHAMDQFKDLEKSSKIKQFSNEGLELQSQKSKRRFTDNSKTQESYDYISDIIQQLTEQNNDLDAEISQLSILKKTKGSYTAQSSIDDVKYKIERNKGHLDRLETILENLDNETLNPEKIDDIKDDLDYYVENNQDEDYVEYDDFYDQLEVGDDELEKGSLARMAVEGPELLAANISNGTPPSSAASTNGNGNVAASNVTKEQVPVTSKPPIAIPVKESSTPTHGTPTKKVRPAIVPAANPPPLNPATSYSNVIKAAQQAASSAPKNPPGLDNITSSSSPEATGAKLSEKDKKEEESSEESQQVNPPVGVAQNFTESGSQSQLPSILGEAGGFADTVNRLSMISQSRLQNPLPFQNISQLLETSLLNCPDSFDAEKPRQYNPVNIHPSSIDYPQEPMYELNSSHIMRKFDNDTLFFCFYYSDGADSFAKHNAVKELTRRGWVFHKEFKQWFLKDNKNGGKNRSMSVIQREEEQDANEVDDREENYKYFDYEKTWLTRRRENYKFSADLRESL
ncbi:uncharacterized protein CANTADRAFT_48363 [Suhomyces tanzawaensis NRRL Y-17324]|uniref:General negative regulator of transcription subunit n=1 Tax=Suhomyces tanzawaensis NRRL Y-17324 TaxID=984487 RepID=A0A1E4SNJ2_9ASCO|nr:uncharacterized protein CANTADRAFT_48363 [Suhomyces tanzawaensis NRRL Y-17324]ODV80952.1 hypothetical protein CANTADRAFT_48363 [Suhomyces tanzawaensis NRRL Y-17324]